MLGECAVARQELGVYLLGTISPADRSVVDRHLAACSRCREELVSLAGLPALLQRVPATDAAVMGGSTENGTGWPPPQELLTTLLSRIARSRRHRRWRLGAAAAGLIAATAAAWALLLMQPPAQSARPPAWSWAASAAGFNPASRAGATVRYSSQPWGTQLEVHVTGIRAGSTCQFWVTGTAGQHILAGAWLIVSGQRRSWYPASAPVPIASMRSFRCQQSRQDPGDRPGALSNNIVTHRSGRVKSGLLPGQWNTGPVPAGVPLPGTARVNSLR